MKFLPELRKFLQELRIIYTVRGYDTRSVWVDVEGIGRCRRTPLGEVHTRDELTPYVSLSGFSSVDDWADKINEFIVSGHKKWLYKIEVEKKHEVDIPTYCSFCHRLNGEHDEGCPNK